MTKDPKGIAGGDVNLYRYVQNSPWMYADPLGLYPHPMDDGAVAAYRDMFTGEFIPRSEVVQITPSQAVMGLMALPAIGALGSIGAAVGLQ